MSTHPPSSPSGTYLYSQSKQPEICELLAHHVSFIRLGKRTASWKWKLVMFVVGGEGSRRGGGAEGGGHVPRAMNLARAKALKQPLAICVQDRCTN